jgi:hypothetical protein
MNARKRRCKVDVFFDAIASVKSVSLDPDFSIWFGRLSVRCTAEQAERLLERDALINFENGEGGSAKLFRRAEKAGSVSGRRRRFYFVGTSPLLDLRASGERRLLV